MVETCKLNDYGEIISWATAYNELRYTHSAPALDDPGVPPYTFTLTRELIDEAYKNKRQIKHKQYIYNSVEQGSKIYQQVQIANRYSDTPIGKVSMANYYYRHRFYGIELNNGGSCFICNPRIVLKVENDKAVIVTKYLPETCRECNKLYMKGLPKDLTLHISPSLMTCLYSSFRIIESERPTGVIALAAQRLERANLPLILHQQLLKVIDIFIEETIQLLIYQINKEKELGYKLHKKIHKGSSIILTDNSTKVTMYPRLDTTAAGQNYIKLNMDNPDKLVKLLQGFNLISANSILLPTDKYNADEIRLIKLMEYIIGQIDFDNEVIKSHIFKWGELGDSLSRLFTLDTKLSDMLGNAVRLTDFIELMEAGKVNIHHIIRHNTYSLEFVIGSLFYPERYIAKS